MPDPWLNFAVALAIGLLIGIDRERQKGDGPTRRAAGLRTFAFAALLGAVAYHVGGVVLLAVAVASIALLAAASYLRSGESDPGITTEITLVATPILGALAMSNVLLAGALASAVAALLAAKKPLHRFAKGILTQTEVNDGIVWLIATLVILPQLPDRFLGPFDALNPNALWLVVILVLSLNALGHAATRVLGPTAGLAASGLAAGFVSSTLTIGAMALQSKRNPATLNAAVAGAIFSTVATFAQMAPVLFVVSRETLVVLVPALASGGIIAVLYSAIFLRRARDMSDPATLGADPAFGILAGLALSATLAAILVVVAALRQTFGNAGVGFGTALAGFVDAHAAAASVAFLVSSAKLSAHDAVVPILAAMSCNAFSKIVMALASGTVAFRLRVVPGLVLPLAVAWAAALVTAGL